MSADQSREPKPAGGQARVLVVDDNDDILNIIQRVLVKENHQVFTARDGKQALAMARRELPDVILLDVMLPEVDGLTVCRELKSDPATRGIMILLVTGRGAVESRAEGLDSGADDYIPKPFHITELTARVRSSLRIKRLTDELKERNRQLVESQRDRLRAEKMATIGLLASGLAHEFNNIMSGISGYAQLAQKNPKYRDQLVQVTLVQSERALELTRSLSTFYRPSVEKRPIAMGAVVENALCLVAKEFEERRIELEKRLPEVRPVLGSAGQLQEVVLNLVLNAIHAIEFDGRLEISLRDEAGKVMLQVKDNGCGIPAENIDRIFDAFFTTKGALGGGSMGGSGLGLSVSYNIVRAHAGSISVESTPGQGTSFTVTLPAAEAAGAADRAAGAAPARLHAPPGSGATPPAGGPSPKAPAAEERAEPAFESMLVADAEEAVMELVCQCLPGCQVAAATTWQEAVDLSRKRAFEWTILDLELPGAPAPKSALEELRKANPEARVIFTSRRYPGRELKETLAHASGHLIKPYSIENLAGIVTRQPADPV
jgi:signal transduction histidine kinase